MYVRHYPETEVAQSWDWIFCFSLIAAKCDYHALPGWYCMWLSGGWQALNEPEPASESSSMAPQFLFIVRPEVTDSDTVDGSEIRLTTWDILYKPCTYWEKLHINRCRISSINTMFDHCSIWKPSLAYPIPLSGKPSSWRAAFDWWKVPPVLWLREVRLENSDWGSRASLVAKQNN